MSLRQSLVGKMRPGPLVLVERESSEEREPGEEDQGNVEEINILTGNVGTP